MDKPIKPLALHASMTQYMVDRLVGIVAEESGVSFDVAKDAMAMRWAGYARERIVLGQSTYLLWEEMVEMANRARPRT